MKKNLFLISIITFLFIPLLLFAQNNDIVASTSWTGAFAITAGADNVVVLAPFELKHPPEYELKPSDIEKIKSSKVIIFAGYEKQVPKLKQTAGKDNTKLIKISTGNSLENIKQQTKIIANEIGTLEKQKENIKEIEKFFYDWDKEKSKKIKVVVNIFQEPFIRSLGYNIIGIFGPTNPSPNLINKLSNLKPDLVIDNYHNPLGEAIAETSKSKYAVLINFPGKDDTETLLDVLTYNKKQILNAKRISNKNIDITLFLILGGLIIFLVMILIFFLKKNKNERN